MAVAGALVDDGVGGGGELRGCQRGWTGGELGGRQARRARIGRYTRAAAGLGSAGGDTEGPG